MRPVHQVRNMSPDGLAAAGNQSLKERVLDLLADISLPLKRLGTWWTSNTAFRRSTASMKR